MVELQVYRDGKREGSIKINIDFFDLQKGLTVPVKNEMGIIQFRARRGFIVEIMHN